MRYLLISAISFACGASAMLASGCVLPGLLAAGGSLLIGILLISMLRGNRRVLGLILLSAAVGGCFAYGYHAVRVLSARNMISEDTLIQGVALDYSTETSFGISVLSEISTENGSARSMTWLYTEEALAPGDSFSVRGRIADSKTYGDFYSYSQGIYLYAYGKGEASIAHLSRIPFRYAPKVIAHGLKASILAAFPEDASPLTLALCLGDRSFLSDTSIVSMKRAGIYHVLALSGLHVSVLMSIVGCFFKRRKHKAVLGVLVCTLFAVISGLSPSIVRACIMNGLLALSLLVRRENDPPTSLGTALLILALQNPWCLFNWGLQLSFMATAGILYLAPRFESLLHHGGEPEKHRKLVAALSVSLGAMTATIPLQMVYFGFVSLVSPISCLLITPVIGVCFGGGLLAAMLGLAAPPAAGVFGWLLAWPFRYIQLVAGVVSDIPFGVIYSDSVYPLIWLVLLYGLVALMMAFPKMKKLYPVCGILSGFAICMLLTMLDLSAGVTALDVGQGQCLVFRNGGGTVMVDCGGSRTPAETASGFLAGAGISRVDLLILTHFDQDHVGGVENLVDMTEIDGIMIPNVEHQMRQDLELLCAKKSIPVYPVAENTDIYFGGDQIHVFAPEETGDDNERSLTALIPTGELLTLVTGDLPSPGEARLLGREALPDVDVLVAGHHGAKSSTSQGLLDAIKPEIVLISVGHNRYGHPADETIARILDSGGRVYRTDIAGTISLKGGK